MLMPNNGQRDCLILTIGSTKASMFFQMDLPFVRFAVFHKSVTELEVCIRIVGMTCQNNLELGDRFIQPVDLEQELAETEMCNAVPFRNRKRSIPKSLRVVPVGSLNPGAPSQNRKD